MSARRQAWRPYDGVSADELARPHYGEQKPHAGRNPGRRPSMVVPVPTVAPVESDDLITDDEWAIVLGDLVRALLCGALVVMAWVAGARWLGIW